MSAPIWELLATDECLITQLAEALEECLREHGGFTIKGECERRARAALSAAKALRKPTCAGYVTLPVEPTEDEITELEGHLNNRGPYLITHSHAESQDRRIIVVRELRAITIRARGEASTAQVVMCEECEQYPADLPSKLCPGCEAYREHTGHF